MCAEVAQAQVARPAAREDVGRGEDGLRGARLQGAGRALRKEELVLDKITWVENDFEGDLQSKKFTRIYWSSIEIV